MKDKLIMRSFSHPRKVPLLSNSAMCIYYYFLTKHLLICQTILFVRLSCNERVMLISLKKPNQFLSTFPVVCFPYCRSTFKIFQFLTKFFIAFQVLPRQGLRLREIRQQGVRLQRHRGRARNPDRRTNCKVLLGQREPQRRTAHPGHGRRGRSRWQRLLRKRWSDRRGSSPRPAPVLPATTAAAAATVLRCLHVQPAAVHAVLRSTAVRRRGRGLRRIPPAGSTPTTQPLNVLKQKL